MVFLSLVSGISTFANYTLLSQHQFSGMIALVIQSGLLLLCCLAAILYKGQRTRPSYGGGFYPIWTLRFSIIMVSLIGNGAVFIVFLLKILGYIDSL